MPRGSDQPVAEAVERLEREFAEMGNALALLGLKQCSSCRKYLRYAEPGALFDGEELVCYKCIHGWWISKSAQLPVTERSAIERRLVHWLIYQHHAKVIKQTVKTIDSPPEGPRMVANCIECNGSGKDTARAPCGHCNGGGTIWIVLADTPR